jgi:hypothetical protein
MTETTTISDLNAGSFTFTTSTGPSNITITYNIIEDIN